MKRVIIFVDYENVTKIQLKKQSELELILYVLIGQQQKSIPAKTLVEITSYTKTPQFIQVNGTTKDNLDFHLCAELGIVHTQEPLSTEFIILSKDKGFDSVIKYFKTQKNRKVRRLASLSTLFQTKGTVKKPSPPKTKEQPSPKQASLSTKKIEEIVDAYSQRLQSMKSTVRPKKVNTLKNDLSNFFKKEGFSTQDIEQIYSVLQNKAIFHAESNSDSISYITPKLSSKIGDMVATYRDQLLAIKIIKRPRKTKTLKNDMSNFFKKEKPSSADIEQIYEILLKERLFIVESSSQKVTYPKTAPQKSATQCLNSKAKELPSPKQASLPTKKIKEIVDAYSQRLKSMKSAIRPKKVNTLKNDLSSFFKKEKLSPTAIEQIYDVLLKERLFIVESSSQKVTYPKTAPQKITASPSKTPKAKISEAERNPVAVLLQDPIEDMALVYSKYLLKFQNRQLPRNVKVLKDDIVSFFKDQTLSPTAREGIYRSLIKKGLVNVDGTTNTLIYPWSN